MFQSFRRAASRGHSILLCLGTLAAGVNAVFGQENSISPSDGIAFDIPSQALISALENYGAAAKREVLYDARLATGRRSADVKGIFAPPEALRILLEGTGLIGRFASENAVVVVPSPETQRTVPTPDAKRADGWIVRARYYGVVQDRIRDAFCSNAMLRPGRYRIAVRFWITPAGAVQQTKLLSTTGNGSVDDAIETALRRVRIGEAPPPGISQPMTMVVLPRPPEHTQDCATIDTVRYNSKAN